MTAGETFIPYRQFQGAFIPEGLLKATGVSRGAAQLYGQLARYAGKDGACYPGQGRLGRDLRASERTVQRWVRQLVDAGLLNRRRRGAGTMTNSYQFVWSDLLGRQLAFDFGEPPPIVEKSAGPVENPVDSRAFFLDQSRQFCRVSEPPILIAEEGQILCSRRSASQVLNSAVENSPGEAPGEPENAPNKEPQNDGHGVERQPLAPELAKQGPQSARSPVETDEDGEQASTSQSAMRARASGIQTRRPVSRAGQPSPVRHDAGRPFSTIGDLIAANPAFSAIVQAAAAKPGTKARASPAA
jgi:helix-turn-helix protein